MERERAFLDHAFARAVERVAEEHELVGIDVEVRVRSRNLPRMPARHDGHEGTEREAAVRHVARLERLVHRRGRMNLARDPVVALDVEDERVQRPFPSGEVERVVTEGDPRDLPATVLHVDWELAPLVLERLEFRRLNLRLNHGRHQGGLALFVQVVRREGDRVDRLHEDEPRLRRCQVDPVGRPLWDRDVHILAEFQIAIFRTDDALPVLDEVHLVPLPVAKEGVVRHGLLRLRDRDRGPGPMDDRFP